MQKIKVEDIAFDFDGVISDSAEALINNLEEKFGIVIRYDDIRVHEMDKQYVHHRKEILECVKMLVQDSVKFGLKPKPGTHETFEAMLSKCDDINIITARPKNTAVVEWLRIHYPSFHQHFNVVILGELRSKKEAFVKSKAKFYVEDRVEYLHEANMCGITPIAFDSPWNLDRHEFARVNDWKQLKSMLCV